MDTNETGRTKLDDLNAKFGDGIVIDPIGVAGNTASADAGTGEGIRYNKDGSVAKRRGRKPGSGTGAYRTRAEKEARSDGIETVLFSLHMMAAQFLRVPELVIDKDEAKKLATAVNAVQEFYNVKTSAEVLLWMQVGGALIAVYGPRIGAVIVRHKNTKTEKRDNIETADNGAFIHGVPAS